MNATFKIGDVVRLKSGGPPLTDGYRLGWWCEQGSPNCYPHTRYGGGFKTLLEAMVSLSNHLQEVGHKADLHLEVFQSNLTAGQNVFRQPHFAAYLRYFISGPDLPDDTIEGFRAIIDVHALGVIWLHLVLGSECWYEPPPSHNPHYDFSLLEEKLRHKRLWKEHTALLVSCLKPREFRPADAQILAERFQRVYKFDKAYKFD